MHILQRVSFLLTTVAALVAAPSVSNAQNDEDAWAVAPLEEDAPMRPPDVIVNTLSSDLVEARGISRMQLLMHSTFSDGRSVFSSASAWALEARADVSVSRSFSITGAVPVGILSGGGERNVFFGNLMLGMGYGTDLSSVEGFRMGFGIDLGLPTSSNPKAAAESIARGVVGSLHAYDVQLYVPALASMRVRGHAHLELSPISLELDLGVVPGITVGDGSAFVFLLSGKARAAARFGVAEPFLELGGTAQVAGTGNIRPPMLIGPGIRLHIGSFFRPAFSMMFNFVEANAIMFGLDLAGITIPSKKVERESFERRDDDFDF